MYTQPEDGALILDLRNVPDLTEDEILEHLPFLCREDMPLAHLLDGELFVNYTRRNCIIKAAALEGVDGAEDYIAELVEKAGAGYVLESDDDDTVVSGHGPETVVVLTDTWTRDGAEALALAAKRAGAVLIGRPTLGTVDLGGDVSYELDERYVLTWPTAITKAAREGRGLFGRGVAPDIYIPWTPAECEADVLMEAAKAYIRETKRK